MKKIFSIILALAMIFSFTACGEQKVVDPAPSAVKVGMVCIGDENSAYDRNFYMAADEATKILAEQGINVEWIYKYNFPDGDGVTVANEELADEGCAIIFNNSYGQEPYMLKVASEFPDIQFVGITNEGGAFDELENTHNAFVRIYEGRYLAGVVAGMKLNEMIEVGNITEDEAIIGYVGAYAFAEVISGYTAYYLGAKSVCPSATMKVSFVNSWGDPALEAAAADALCNQGCVIISQHSDSTTPATMAQSNGVFHTGYNIGMADIAPESSIISTRVDWTNYFVYTISAVAKGGNFDQDYCHGLAEGEVVMTELNEDIAPAGAAEKLKEVEAKIVSGEIKVFDTETFTVNGEKITQAFALDTNGDWIPDSEEAIVDGEFKESLYKSAPYFALQIDGITLLN